MDFNKIINNQRKNLVHSSHGGEIYDEKNFKSNSKILDFSINVNPLAITNNFLNLNRELLLEINRYPDSNSSRLKKAIVSYFNYEISVENLIIGAGSMDIISIFCDTVINPGDNVVICQPTFSEYKWAIQKNSGQVINTYRNPIDNFCLRYESIVNNINNKTKAIFICNPNNPNGLLDDAKIITEVIKFTSQKDIIIFLDEAFIEFAGEVNSFVKEIKNYENLFICRNFSKFFGIPGLRIGYGVSNPILIKYMQNTQNLWSVNCVGQRLAEKILSSNDFIKKSIEFVNKERYFLVSELKKFKQLKIYPTHSNFILIDITRSGIKSLDLKHLFLRENILIRDCSNFDNLDENFIRISIKNRNANLKLINTFKKIMNWN